MKKILVLILALCLMLLTLAGCGKDNTDGTTNNSGETSSDTPVEVDFGGSDADMFTERDSKTDYDEATAIKIELKGNDATASDNSVKISGSTVTITKDATHIISGSLTDGMIIVDAPDTAKLQLVLKSADITSKTSAPLYIKQADKVFVTLVGDNILTSGDNFTAIDDNNIDGTVFSKQDLTFNGEGTLTVSSPVGHGIVGKDDLVFTGGSYTITSASHGIQANDSVRIKAATIEADTGKDGIHAENTDDTAKGFVYISSGNVKIESEGDGISSSSYMQIADGSFEINAGGGYENGTKEHSDNFGAFGGGGGMHGGGQGGGGMSANSNGSIVVSGGTLYINSSGDGMDANGTLSITGGHTTVVGPTQGDTATLDYDKSGIITGGTFIGTGASNMAQSFSSSSQGVIAVSIGSQSANTKIILKDKNGKELISYAPELSFQVVILSTPEMKSGETYTITVGTESGEFEAS